MTDDTPDWMDESQNIYVNITKNNLFTEKGRIAPGGKVLMDPAEAKKYLGKLVLESELDG